MAGRIRVGIVDDHPLYRDGIVFALESEAGIEVVAQGMTAEDAVGIATDLAPDVLLLDLGIAGGGHHAIERIGLRYPGVRILVLTVEDTEEQMFRALSAGAQGYLLKGASSVELIDTIRAVDRGERYVPPNFAARVLMNFARATPRTEQSESVWPEFSRREEQILSMITRQMSNKQIGEDLKISEKTVKHHVTAILRKLDVRTREEAATLALVRNTTPHHDIA